MSIDSERLLCMHTNRDDNHSLLINEHERQYEIGIDVLSSYGRRRWFIIRRIILFFSLFREKICFLWVYFLSWHVDMKMHIPKQTWPRRAGDWMVKCPSLCSIYGWKFRLACPFLSLKSLSTRFPIWLATFCPFLFVMASAQSTVRTVQWQSYIETAPQFVFFRNAPKMNQHAQHLSISAHFNNVRHS